MPPQLGGPSNEPDGTERGTNSCIRWDAGTPASTPVGLAWPIARMGALQLVAWGRNSLCVVFGHSVFRCPGTAESVA